MAVVDELRQVIIRLGQAAGADGLAEACLRGIEVLSSLPGKEIAVNSLLGCAPAPGNEGGEGRRWLEEVQQAIKEAVVGGRRLVIKTMHLTHGVRETVPFDDTTTMADVERHLSQLYLSSIRDYITRFTSELIGDEPIRLDFFSGTLVNGQEPRPLDPETPVATLPGAQTDGVYWWPRAKQPRGRPLDSLALHTSMSLMMRVQRSVVQRDSPSSILRGSAARQASSFAGNSLAYHTFWPSEPGTPRGQEVSDEVFNSLEDYEILCELGRGGMGVVYKARQKSCGRIVALKVLRHKQANGANMAFFQQEIRFTAALDHPGIVPLFDFGEVAGWPYYTMAFVEGDSLAMLVRTRGPLPPRTAAMLLSQVAVAVAYAHGKGIVHCDLKPNNILLDSQGNPRITDFGLAHRLQDGPNLRIAGLVLGTPSYMSPEQALGATELTPSVDIYALGAVLYALLVGQGPFPDETIVSKVLRKVIQEPPPSMRQINPDLPMALERIVLRCLEKEPRNRYPTAADLAADLCGWLETEKAKEAQSSQKGIFDWLMRVFGRRTKKAEEAQSCQAAGKKTTETMTCVQVLVYEDHQLKGSAEFDGQVELGRQRDQDEELFSRKQENGVWRWVIALRDETTVGRNQLLLTPLLEGKLRLSNGSDKQAVRIADRPDLQPSASSEVALPILIILGPTKTLRIQASPGAGYLQSRTKVTMVALSASHTSQPEDSQGT